MTSKNRSGVIGLVLGFGLGIIGIIIVACLSDRNPSPLQKTEERKRPGEASGRKHPPAPKTDDKDHKHAEVRTQTATIRPRQTHSHVKIKVYKRWGDLAENAKAEENQEFDNDSISIKVRRIDVEPLPSYESTQTFHCPWCNKLYEVDVQSPNLVFWCIKCENQFLVYLLTADESPKETADGKPPPLPKVEERKSPKEASARKPTPPPKVEELRFKVIFCGEIAAGYEIEQVQRDLAKLCKQPVEKVAAWFSGKRVVIKKETDYTTAMKFHRTFDRVGAHCIIEPAKKEA